MKYILFTFLLLSNFAFSQDSASTFWKNRCDYKTDGTGKSLGLKIKLSVPCTWMEKEGERPHVVKKFTNSLNGNTAMATLIINKMPAIPSKAEMVDLFTQKGLKELCQDLGTFISGRKIKIDGLDCGEVAFKMVREAPISTIYMYNLYYYMVYKDKMIVLGYATGSAKDKTAKELFESYKILFKGLANDTVFISKWE